MTASALTSVNGDASQSAHAVAYGSTVNLALVSTADVSEVVFSFVSNNHGSSSFPTIASAGFGSATFTMDADPGTPGIGISYLMQTVANPGLPNQAISTYVVGNASGSVAIPICPGETMERHPTLGWLYAIKQLFPGL